MKRLILLPALVVITVFAIAGCKQIPQELKTEFAFVSSMENDGAFDIYIMSLPSQEVRQITHTQGKNVENVWLDWSPAGPIAFASTRDGNYEVYIISPDGSGETRLTENEHFDGYPTLRWDGKMIAFSSDVQRRNKPAQKDIFLMDVGTKKKERLTDTPQDEISVRFSPDGKKLAYSRYVGGQSEIFIYSFATRESNQLTDNMAEDVSPSWTSDSKYIIFASNRLDTIHPAREKLYSIFMMDAEGMGACQPLIQKKGTSIGMPSISADNKWVIYQYKKLDWDWMYVGMRSVTEPKKEYRLVKNDYYNRNPVWKPKID